MTAESLAATLQSPDAVVRSTAAEILGYLGVKDSGTAGAALMDLLNDPEVIVRSAAADALGVLGYAPAVEAIKALLLNDPEPLVRASSAETLGDIGDESALGELELALRDADDAVRGYAANSIGLIGAPYMLPKLASCLAREQSPAVKAELHGARYRLGVAGDLNKLLNLLEGADEGLAVNILNILNDLSSRSRPATLAGDAARIREAVATIAHRMPLLRGDAEKQLRRLTDLMSNSAALRSAQ